MTQFACVCGRTVSALDVWMRRWPSPFVGVFWEALRCSKECLERAYPERVSAKDLGTKEGK